MTKPVLSPVYGKYLRIVFLCALLVLEINIGIILILGSGADAPAAVQETETSAETGFIVAGDKRVYIGAESSEPGMDATQNATIAPTQGTVAKATEQTVSTPEPQANGIQLITPTPGLQANASEQAAPTPEPLVQTADPIGMQANSMGTPGTDEGSQMSSAGSSETTQELPANSAESSASALEATISPEPSPVPHEKTPKSAVQTSLSPIQWGDRSRAALSLTFDDGYNAKAIVTVLDVLKKYNIKSTFFIVGEALRNNSGLWKRAIEEGHQICNHTEEHQSLSKLSLEGAKKQILDWEKTAESVLGEDYVARMKKEFPYLRLPGGNGSNDKKLLAMIADLGYTTIGWSDETCYAVLRHYNLKTASIDKVADEIVRHISGNAGNGSIILLHFNPYDTARFEDIVKGIINKDLEIVQVTEVIQ